jgi:ubiquinone/menaquinone biosynthesis C-methylase UbiE
MNTKQKNISTTQKILWDKFSSNWREWDQYTMSFFKPHGDAIIQYLKPKSTDFILDVASGTGEPGLTIASLLTGGEIIVSDLSGGMLKIAKEKAVERKITNMGTKVANVCELPFADNSFDAISCRLGFMFFPDLLLAAKELARVLKPDGRIATTVWGLPHKNYWATCITENIRKHVEMPEPKEGAPNVFRCAEEGFISELFKQAGIKNVMEKEIIGEMKYKNAEEYWSFMTSIAAPIVETLSKTDEETKNKIKAGVIKDINEKYPNKTELGTSGILIYGEK